MMNFMNNNKQIIGVLSILTLFAVWSNTANAVDVVVENNLSSTVTPSPAPKIEASKEALSVSRQVLGLEKANETVSHSEKILKKYENSTKLTDSQLKELLWAVGFRGNDLIEAWAVAKKESGGRPLALNESTRTGDSSFGLFQINMIGDLGPDRREKFNLEYNVQLFSPVVNAAIAYYMSNGGKDWSAWHGITQRTKRLMSEFPN